MLRASGRAVAVLGLGVLLIVSPPATTAHAQAPAACPANVAITVAPPAPGAPTTVTITVSPAVPLKAASANDPSSYHLHYFVDTEATPAGSIVPTANPKVIHSAALTQDIGPLTAGTHTVTVVLGLLNHAACEARESATFIMGAAAAAPIVPKSGNAGLAASSRGALVVVLLVGVTVAVVVAARLWTPRGRP